MTPRAALSVAMLMATYAAPAAQAADCRGEPFEGDPYTICEVDLSREQLTLFLDDARGDTFGYFSTIDDALASSGKRLGFAMYAGMYHDDRAPVGLYIENGVEVQGLITSAGPGNFGLLPNGVLCLRPGRADVIETARFARPPRRQFRCWSSTARCTPGSCPTAPRDSSATAWAPAPTAPAPLS